MKTYSFSLFASLLLTLGGCMSDSPAGDRYARHAELEEHCAELLAQIDRLRGKPQRRAAASNRYRLECVD